MSGCSGAMTPLEAECVAGTAQLLDEHPVFGEVLLPIIVYVESAGWSA